MSISETLRVVVDFEGGLKMLSIRVDSIESTRIVFPVVDSPSYARRDSVRIESRRNVRIESNRKVPQTNRLSLDVLDMDGSLNKISYF